MMNKHKKKTEQEIEQEAAKTKFGDRTVQIVIDNIVGRGYNQYVHLHGYTAILKNHMGHTFALHNQIECEYAELTIKKLAGAL